MLSKSIRTKKGFTLIETLVGIAVFMVVATATYQAYVSLFALIGQNQYKILALNLANEQFEIIRNLSYTDVGVDGAIPDGRLTHVQTVTRGGIPFTVTLTVRNIDLPFDGTIGGTPNDLSPADNKLAEVMVECPTCKTFTPITLSTNVAPKALETLSANGALFVRVFDANGIAVPDANVHIEYATSSPIVIDDVTDSLGFLKVIDAPPAVQAYKITVSKPGYSTDMTYTPGAVGNPSPTKPHATVVKQQVTQVSFAIDRVSAVTFSSVTPACVAVPNIDFTLVGSKQIGASVPKYSKTLITNSSGIYSSSTTEWDTYTLTGTDGSYDIIGLNPLNAISINPNSTQNISLIVAPKDPNSVLVTVKDSATGLPVTDANVELKQGATVIGTQITDRGFVNQTDWSGGSGQASSTDEEKYFSDDGNVDVTSTPGEIKLRNAFGTYNPSGTLESSTFDTGSASNFYNLTWSPTDQPVPAGAGSVRLQFATNATLTATTTWNYVGPDGTSATYYTVPGSTLSSTHADQRYARYKVYLSTAVSTSTPNISDIAFTLTSSCTPPGQVVFTGLSTGSYTLTVSKTGYTTKTSTVAVSGAWREEEIILAP